MSLTFSELKQLIFDDVIDQASIIANHIGAKIILTGSDENAKMYVYDETTISYKKSNKSNDLILTVVSSSVKSLIDKERRELEKMCGKIKISSNNQINLYMPQLRQALVVEDVINEIHFKNGKYLIDKGMLTPRESYKRILLLNLLNTIMLNHALKQ